MKKILFLILFTSLYIGAKTNCDKEFSLTIPETFNTETLKNDLIKWQSSLIKNLGYNSKKIAKEVFLKTDITLTINGSTSKYIVYQSSENKNRFYIHESLTIIDFELKKIGTMGVNGISQHPTISKKMVVILAPHKNINLLGVTLDNTKASDTPPEFNKKSVKFKWQMPND